MSYQSVDESTDSSRPGELYQFTGGIQAYYTSYPETILHGGIGYKPEYIRHDKVEVSEELNKQQLEITVKNSNPVALQYKDEIPVLSVNVRVYRFVSLVDEFRLIWAGKIAKATFNSDSDECVLTCDPIFSMLRRMGLRRNYQLLCPYSLYDNRCKVNYLEYRKNDKILFIQNNTIETNFSLQYGSNYYTGGVLIYDMKYYLIINHNVSGDLILVNPLKAKVNDNVMLVAGCDKHFNTCSGKFQNAENFGGFPLIPLKNPFTGDSLAS
jgi:uncharacterized phage protein (TIGR02218 family)